ncbi:G-PROTEIN-RECEP-F1-2 domain-containing protein [Aphelenchoides fujianensis]|nr:G-PROTEIN-RECEP-F1-2 domain-containing protein [Aphelenchoides fujianensis]
MSAGIGNGAVTTLSTVASAALGSSEVADGDAAVSLAVEEIGVGSWILIFVMGVLSVVTIGGNLIVLLSYYLDKNIRQPSNYFIFSLAISDLSALN